MSRIFYRKKFSDYLGEQRAIDDIVQFYIPDGGVTPTPTPVPVTPTPTPSITPTRTLTPTPTKTSTPTPTRTPAPACDITYTELPSPTPSPTPTITPTNTSSPTPTPSPIAPFSPTSISDLVGWFDAGQGVNSSFGDVNTWDDLSNTMGDFTYSTGTKAQHNLSGFGTNNLPYIHGYNGGTYITASNWLTTTASTVYVICSLYQSIGGAYQRYMEQSGYGTGFIFLDASSGANDEPQFGFTTNLVPSANFDPTLNTPSVLRAKWNGLTNLIKLNNGVEVNTGSALSSQPSNPLYLFNAANTNFGAGFDVAEIIIYNKVLNTTETTNLENYISTKYGITL